MTRPTQRTLCGSAAHEVSRRAFLGTGTGAVVGGTAGLGVLGSPAFAEQLKKTEKRVILLFLSGGASQFETWDPKPGRPTGGPFLKIPSSVPGVRISELMPRMAQEWHRTLIKEVDSQMPIFGVSLNEAANKVYAVGRDRITIWEMAS